MYKALTCALIAAVAPAFANEGWLTNIDKAVEQAAKDKKSVLVEFTGSDWCPPCKMLKSQIFSSEEFKKLADKDLVLVELDFPREKAIPEAQKAYNQEMSAKYGIEGFPTVYLLNGKGQPYWVRVGGGEKTEYLASLGDAIKKNAEISDLLDKADKASGMEKAKLQAEALNRMPEELVQAHYAGMVSDIAKTDKEDTLGYGKKLKEIEHQKAVAEEQKQVEGFMTKEVLPLFQQKKYAEVVKKTTGYLDSHDKLSTETKQMILIQVVSQANMANKDIDGALATLAKAAKLDPKSKGGQFATSMIENIKTNRAQIEQQLKAADKAGEADKKGK